MGSCDDRHVATKIFLNFLVKVIGVEVGEQDSVYWRKLLQIDSWVRHPSGCHAWAEVNVVSSMEEVGI